MLDDKIKNRKKIQMLRARVELEREARRDKEKELKTLLDRVGVSPRAGGFVSPRGRFAAQARARAISRGIGLPAAQGARPSRRERGENPPSYFSFTAPPPPPHAFSPRRLITAAPRDVPDPAGAASAAGDAAGVRAVHAHHRQGRRVRVAAQRAARVAEGWQHDARGRRARQRPAAGAAGAGAAPAAAAAGAARAARPVESRLISHVSSRCHN